MHLLEQVRSRRLELPRDYLPLGPQPSASAIPPRPHTKQSNNMVRVKGVEPPHPKILDPKSSASANSATPAHKKW
jgi:hypothetical protein